MDDTTSPLVERLFEAAAGMSCGEMIKHEIVWERAIDLGVDATLAHLCLRAGGELPPERRAERRMHIVDTIARRQDLLASYTLLERAVGRVLVLKGEPLARMFFEDGYARRSGDVDLLCAPEDVESAWRALTEAGYRALHGARPRPLIYNQWACCRPETGRVVELHWKLSAPEIGEPSFDALYARSSSLKLGEGGDVRLLRPSDQLLHAAYHFHHHMGFFKGLLDVAAWWDRYGQEATLYHEARREAAAHGVEKILRWPIAALDRLCIHYRSVAPQRDALLPELFGAWTATCVQGALTKTRIAQGVDFKTVGVTQEEVLLWRLLGLALVEGGARKGIGVVFRSPEVMRRERGGDRIEGEDWWRWIQRIMRRGEARL